jgi:hypothetical protein
MKRKVIFVLVLIVILFGLVAWTPASPVSFARTFVTQDCLVQSPSDTGVVSLETAVPSCWMAEQFQ